MPDADTRLILATFLLAGMDMALALIAQILDDVTAERVATWAENEWQRDPDWDTFAKIYGLA